MNFLFRNSIQTMKTALIGMSLLKSTVRPSLLATYSGYSVSISLPN